jgi:hypothetical protein
MRRRIGKKELITFIQKLIWCFRVVELEIVSNLAIGSLATSVPRYGLPFLEDPADYLCCGLLRVSVSWDG